MNTLVLEQTEHGEVPVDVYQKLSSDRILFLANYLDDDLASDIVATLLLKDHEDSEKKITLFINSPGGDIRNVLMIYDVMEMIHCSHRDRVHWCCHGRSGYPTGWRNSWHEACNSACGNFCYAVSWQFPYAHRFARRTSPV